MPPLSPGFISSTDARAKLQYEKELFVGVSRAAGLLNPALGLVGDGPQNAIQRKTKLFEQGGTRARVYLQRPFRGRLRYGNAPEHGNEEGQRTVPYDFEINEVRKSAGVQGWRIQRQRVPYEVWGESRFLLSQFFGSIFNAAYQMHLCGITTDVSTTTEWWFHGEDLGNTLCNAPRASDVYHTFRPGGYTTDEAVGADPTAYFDVPFINALRARAGNMANPIRPFNWRGKDVWGLTLHPDQVAYLRTYNTEWLELAKRTMTGDTEGSGPIADGFLGIYNRVLLIEDGYAPPGVNSSTGARVVDASGNTLCRRNSFFGAQALTVGYAKMISEDNQFVFDEQSWDYDHNKGVCATTFMGIAAPGFILDEVDTTLVQDHGKITCTFYAAPL